MEIYKYYCIVSSSFGSFPSAKEAWGPEKSLDSCHMQHLVAPLLCGEVARWLGIQVRCVPQRRRSQVCNREFVPNAKGTSRLLLMYNVHLIRLLNSVMFGII